MTPTSTTTTPATQNPAALRAELDKLNQSHVLRFYDALSQPQQQQLLADLASIDLARLPALIDRYVASDAPYALPDSIDPVPYYPTDPADPHRPWDRAKYKAAGINLVAQGKVCAFTVAGGQGTRLGYDGPKGCYPAGAVSNKPLFACLAEWITAARKRFSNSTSKEANIPWYIMTSPINHDATVAYFKQHNHFGLPPSDVMFFPQGVMPSLALPDGKLLLAEQHRIAVNPDGHGGSLKALHTSGALADMRKRGIEHISYVQVDNPLVRVIDPVFIGLHATAEDSSAEMSSKMIPKAYPEEKLGVLCKVNNRTAVIEYSDLPDTLANERRPDGVLRYNAGNTAVHVLSVAFVEKLNTSADFALPYHRAVKKVPYIDLNTATLVNPDKPNAVKLETFVFDALPLAERSIVLETLRQDEFAPIKNADGNDSPESSRKIQTNRAATWLSLAGLTVPTTPAGEPDATLELTPSTAIYPEDITETKNTIPQPIKPGTSLVL